MKRQDDLKEVINYIEEKLDSIRLNEVGKSNIAVLLDKYEKKRILEAIDISFGKYIYYNNDGAINRDSINNFISKIGGIIYNNSLSDIEKKINHIKNYGNKSLNYWNDITAQSILNRYIDALKKANWNEAQIIEDLEKEVLNLLKGSSNWSQWRNQMENWIEDIKKWNEDDGKEEIVEEETILPAKLYQNTRNYIEQLSKQINSSYENNLYDCTAVIMRRLIEVLLILSFQHHKIESKILDKTGNKYVSLDKIIKIAQSEKSFSLTTDTKQYIDIFRELGNLSAHKIWYNCTKKDIETLILKYRAITEELLYTAGIMK